jgi:ectoine hydroxylase-related dioxygenase (phytanoyl-CoA dioxygenase family)
MPFPSLATDGFQIVPSFLDAGDVKGLCSALSGLDIAPGHRQLMERVPEVAALAVSSKVNALVNSVLGEAAAPVRSIFFDKTAGANWLVPWHQDLSIAVRERRDVPGYGPWSVKGGVPHVQPPPPVLEEMVTLRLHLDDCDASNGALLVIPGSHRSGRLDAAAIAAARAERKPVLCSMKAGDALLMRPLLLHASSEAVAPSHRRVIHLEYSASPLPLGLEWAESLAEKS